MNGGDDKGLKLTRRAALFGAAAILPAQVPIRAFGQARGAELPPVVFIHGNGDSAAQWINNLWRFEANGYRRNQLFALDFAYPMARSDDSNPQPFRTSTEDELKALQAFVAQVRKTTRRRGVGSRLMALISEQAKEEGRVLRIATTTLPLADRVLLSKLGYRPIADAEPTEPGLPATSDFVELDPQGKG